MLECYYDADHGMTEAFHQGEGQMAASDRSRTVVVVNEKAEDYDESNVYWHNEFPVC